MLEAGHALFMQHGFDESRFFSDAFEWASAESILGLKQGQDLSCAGIP
jgi:hypothetical protein